MKLLTFITLLLLVPTFMNGQEAWLSTPESIQEFRGQVESMKPAASQYEVQVSNKTIPLEDREIAIRMYRPKGNGLKPTLIYVHGACWVAGSLNSHDEICRYLSAKGDVVVIAIDYRLAPENTYPAAHNDVYEGIEWLWNNANELGLTTDKFAIAGESAGAYLSAATTLRARDTKNSPDFSFQLLVYGALDGGGSSWTPCKDLYFNDTQDVRSDYGSPLWAKNLSGLPPTFNIFGQYEISRAEEELFIRKLKEQNVPTKTFMHQGVGHDVGSWLSVQTETPAHIKAIEYLKEGFNTK
jgi:acetyl esterase